MNRAFDERLELQLQEYEFAELDQLLPAGPLVQAMTQVEDHESAIEAIINRY